jgi:hypothetical protein
MECQDRTQLWTIYLEAKPGAENSNGGVHSGESSERELLDPEPSIFHPRLWSQPYPPTHGPCLPEQLDKGLTFHLPRDTTLSWSVWDIAPPRILTLRCPVSDLGWALPPSAFPLQPPDSPQKLTLSPDLVTSGIPQSAETLSGEMGSQTLGSVASSPANLDLWSLK